MRVGFKSIIIFIWVFVLMISLMGATKLQFYTDVYAWYPDGKIKKISSGDGIYFQPCIHPGGTHVVYYGNSKGTPRVWKADLETGVTIALTSSEANARHPVFDWKGERIAFSSDHVFDQKHETVEEMTPSGDPPINSHFNIFIMDVDGKNVRQITKGPFQDERPCFSPDGKEIVFVSNRLGKKNGLWRVSVDGTKGPWPLLRRGWGYRPWYSVDGQWIFFYSGINRRHRICKVSAKGGEVIPLTNDNLELSHGPFADPSGKSILAHGIKKGEFHGIWEIPLDGGPPKQLMPKGFENVHHGHATRAKNGVITFDALRFTK
jgi:Tol biopolymer transport system component